MTLMVAALTLMIAMSAAGQYDSSNDRWRTGERAMQRYVPTTVAASDGAPPNLLAPPAYLAIIDAMLQRSPTFRRQCARIAADTLLTVEFTPGVGRARNGAAAETRILRRADGRRHAEIIVWEPVGLVELIAHEIEHIVEQLDGVDLHARAAGDATGVLERAPNRFETRRAMLIGRKVAREVDRR